MKKLLSTICMLTLALSLSAQEATNSGWIIGEQESSFPGEMIQYAVCPATKAVEGKDGDITVSLNAMIFRGVTKYFFSSKGDNFKVDNLLTQRVVIKVDDEKSSQFALSGNNNYTSNTLTFDGSYKSKFRNMLKKGKKCHITVEFADNDIQEFDFNIEGLTQTFLK